MPEHIRVAEQLAHEKEQWEAEEEAERRTRLRRMQQLAQETERTKNERMDQQLARARRTEMEEQQTLQLRHDLNRALRNEDWADEQSRELERLHITQLGREQELEYHQSRATAALSQQTRLYSAGQEHHKQL